MLAGCRRPIMGAAINTQYFGDSSYTAVAGQKFDIVTPEGEMKWAATEPARNQFNFGPGDQIVQFAEAHHQQVHGHNLVWHLNNPAWLTQGKFTDAELISILQNHVTQVVSHWRGKIAMWDVVNEAVADDGTLRKSFWFNHLGRSYIDIAFRAAHAADPNAKFYYNDYGNQAPGAKANGIHDLVQGMKARGVPVDGVGMQMHLTLASAPTTSELTTVMNHLANLGVDVAITEMDVRLNLPAGTTGLNNQANVYQRVLNVCRAIERCSSFTTWGFTDKYSWIPSFFPGFGAALPFDQNYAAKPAANVLQSQYRS